MGIVERIRTRLNDHKRKKHHRDTAGLMDELTTIPLADDEALVRWVANLLIHGHRESEIRRRLNENRLIPSRAHPDEWRRLMRAANEVADDMRWLVLAKAELNDGDWLRLDSYARRKRAMARLEAVIESAHGQADSVSKLNSVSFMVGGLLKAQDSMDSFTGAKDSPALVQVNIGYDPLQQFREVIQTEASFEVVDEEE